MLNFILNISESSVTFLPKSKAKSLSSFPFRIRNWFRSRGQWSRKNKMLKVSRSSCISAILFHLFLLSAASFSAIVPRNDRADSRRDDCAIARQFARDHPDDETRERRNRIIVDLAFHRPSAATLRAGRSPSNEMHRNKRALRWQPLKFKSSFTGQMDGGVGVGVGRSTREN